MLSDLLFRLRVLLRRQRAESDLDDELQFHLAHEAEKYQAAGMPPEEAVRGARLALGGVDQTKEICRDARGVNWLETTGRDIGYAVRSLRTQPLFAATVIVSLALGIGANVASFTLMRAALWKPLPVSHPEQIVHLQRLNPGNPSDGEFGYSYVLFEQLRQAAHPDCEVVAKSRSEIVRFGINTDSSERAIGEAVSANFFSGLKVKPFIGRVFEPHDDNLAGGRRVAVLSYRFWTQRFRSDPSVLGRTVSYKETPYTVIGVAQPRFDGVEAETLTDVWIPISTDVPTEWLTSAQINWLRLLARLEPDANRGQVEAKLYARFRSHLEREILPDTPPHFKAMVEGQRLHVRPAAAGLSTTGRKYEQPLLILMGVVALVLLICCANIANLVMARNRARQAEIAVRRALGASRGRIISQLFTENLVLALAGTAAGLFLASWASRLLISLLSESESPLAFDLAPDFTVLAFTIGLGIATALLFGLIPAFRASEPADALTLKSGARVSGRSHAGKLLAVGQLALSLLLLIGAGLFLETIRNLKSIDLGFQYENVLTFDLSFPKTVPPERVQRAFEDLRDRLDHAPGLVAATYAWPSVYGRGGWSFGIKVEGRPSSPGEDNEAGMIAAGPDFFKVMQMELLRGRYLTARDMTNAPLAAVVNESFARYYFPDGSSLGRRIEIPGKTPETREIVGVVRDAKHYGAREKAWRMVYVPAFREGSFFVRTSATRASLATLIQSTVSEANASAQVEHIRPFESVVDEMASRERMIAALSAVFGGVALLLSAVGLFGVMAYNVARRTPELGIRLALGAQRSDVQWLILSETMRMVLAGTAIGATAAFALTRLVSSMLYGVKPNDTGVFVTAALVLALAGGIAGFLPAWRASRIDPIVSLRYE